MVTAGEAPDLKMLQFKLWRIEYVIKLFGWLPGRISGDMLLISTPEAGLLQKIRQFPGAAKGVEIAADNEFLSRFNKLAQIIELFFAYSSGQRQMNK